MLSFTLPADVTPKKRPPPCLLNVTIFVSEDNLEKLTDRKIFCLCRELNYDRTVCQSAVSHYAAQ